MLTITLEDGTQVQFDLLDPNNGLITPKLPISPDRTYTMKKMMEYAHQIATTGFYVDNGDETFTYTSPECICGVSVPNCLNLNETI